jgi:hypothetical protein
VGILVLATGASAAQPKPKAPLALSKARLASSFNVTERIASVSGIDAKVGTTLRLTWKFMPKCSSGACTTGLTFSYTHPSMDEHTAKVLLTRRGATYTGASSATLIECSVEDVYGTMGVQLRVTKGAWINGKWRAARFTGSMRYEASESTAALGAFRCPAARFTATVRGTLE